MPERGKGSCRHVQRRPSGGGRCRSPWWRARPRPRSFAAKPGASETVVHKWRLFRALTEAKEPLGVTERALSVLHALLSFHQETALTLPGSDSTSTEAGSASAGIVVFPSNKELSIRAHGMAPATLRRHLACLVDAGLDHPPRFTERQTLRQKRAGGSDRGRFRLRPRAAGGAGGRNREPRRGGAGREPRDRAAARKDHAHPPRHRQDDRDRIGGGRFRRLGRARISAMRRSPAVTGGGFRAPIWRLWRASWPRWRQKSTSCWKYT